MRRFGRPMAWTLSLAVVIALIAASIPSLRAYRLEGTIKQRIARASSVSIVFRRDGPRAVPDFYTPTTVTDPRQVARLKKTLGVVRQYDAATDKCFEGLDEWSRRYWPRVVFTTPEGEAAVIYLPWGDCGVWPDGLPWGWGWGGTELAHEAWKLTQKSR